MKKTALLVLLGAACAQALASDGHDHSNQTNPASHAPVGVMGDHMHKKGEFMMSYRFMSMSMEDNLQGSDSISSAEIATTANTFGMPATLRIAPTEMTTDMHMLGFMYAPSDDVTLFAMLNYIEKEMTHTTFMGMAGTNVRGEFVTKTSGLGDTKVGALWRLFDDGVHHVHFNGGLSLPTGSIDEEDDILSPMGTRPTVRLPYPMQLGSGTYDLMPGITYTGNSSIWGWGAQYAATIRIGENNEDYSLGDVHKINAWGSVNAADWLSTSLRLSYKNQDDIAGKDAKISGPVQTADPENQGGNWVNLGIGFNIAGQGSLKGHRLAFEYELPLMQDVNGIQMEMQDMYTLGYQYSL